MKRIIMLLLLIGTVSAQHLYDDIWDYAKPLICGLFVAFVWIGGSIASVMFVYAGGKYLMSADDPAARKAAKDMLIHVLIAIIIIMVGFYITDVVSQNDIEGCVTLGWLP